MANNDWTNKLRSKLSDYQAPIPEGLWEDIEASLPQPGVNRRRVLMTPWRKWSAAAAIALALMGGGTYLWQHYGDQPSQPIAIADKHERMDNLQNHESLAFQENIDDAENLEDEDGLDHVGRKDNLYQTEVSEKDLKPATTAHKKGVTVAAQPNKLMAENHSESTEEVSSVSTAPDNQQENIPTPAKPHRTPSTPSWSTPSIGIPVGGSKKENQPLMLAFFASNDAFSFNNSSPVLNYAMANSVLFDENDDTSKYWLHDYEEEINHHHPVSMGMGMRFGLNKRFAISTGLVYTYLKSDFVFKMGGTTLERNQVLHYVGVPVNLIYNIWSKYGLTAYTTAGLQTDFCVKATLESEGKKKDIDNDRMQFSTMFGLGLQYNFTPSVGLYVEPSLKYYFDNGSNLENAYKDKPTNIGFQFGLRYNIDK